LAVVVAALGLAGAGVLFPWGVGREPLFYKWAVVVAALGVAGAGILLLLGVVREPLSYKWAVAVAALGVYAAGILLLLGVGRGPLFYKWAVAVAALGVAGAGILLLLGVGRGPLFFKWAVAVAALGVYAAGILLLWRVVREPLFFKWAVAVAALGVYAAGILLLWRVVREPLFFKWGAVVVALGVCAAGILLLWGVWDGTPVAAAFTRVGGATRVETALEASRFWLTPPQYVVKTRTDSSQVMLGAAQCAIVHDAPLLFTAQDSKRKQRVNAIINDWRNIRKQERVRKREHVARLEVIHITSQHDVTDCMGKRNRAYVDRLSTLEVLQLPQLRPQIPVRQTLAHVVVFAAAIKPGHLPDVAVGLALAAHMARANREKVSLVVVPHYLESDPELENKLQSQHQLVTGGVVLGQTPTVPEDTRALLRQLLTSRDRQGVLAQVQDNLGSVGSLIAALLALVGLATATGIAGPIVIERLKRNERIKSERDNEENLPLEREEPVPSWKKTEEGPEPSTEKASDWITALGDTREVTVWLRSGRQVAGTITSQVPVDTRDATVFRIRKTVAPPRAEPSPDASPPRSEEKYAYVLVSVKEIEQIHFNDPKSGGTNANQKSP
jgi:hypothetical protein